MEERLKQRNSKSSKQLIVKNPLNIDEDDYDTKVYRGEIQKEARANNVDEVDEGLQIVFALPSISTKKAKILHRLVTGNVIREDRMHRAGCTAIERSH